MNRVASPIGALVLSVAAGLGFVFEIADPEHCFLALILAALWRIESKVAERRGEVGL